MRTQAVVILLVIIILIYGCGTPSPFPLSFPSVSTADDRIIGNWKMEEDTNKYNFYEITRRDTVDKYYYHVRFFDRGGSNPSLETNIFFSEVHDGRNNKMVKFLNIPYWEKAVDKSKGDLFGWNDRGYFFVRILEANDDFSRITTATVNDKKLQAIKQASKLEYYIQENLNNPAIYSDTVHLYKVDKSSAELRQPR